MFHQRAFIPHFQAGPRRQLRPAAGRRHAAISDKRLAQADVTGVGGMQPLDQGSDSAALQAVVYQTDQIHFMAECAPGGMNRLRVDASAQDVSPQQKSGIRHEDVKIRPQPKDRRCGIRTG